MANLAALRQELGKVLGAFAGGSATGGSTVTLVDANSLVDPLVSADVYRDHWLLITSGTQAGQMRRVSSYNPATGTLTVNRAYSPAGPASADTYELHGLLSPEQLRDCINRSLARCLYSTTYDLTTVESQREYTLPTWIADKWQVYSVRKRYGSTANQYYWRDVWFDFRMADGAAVLEVAPRPASETLTVYCLRPYPALSADTDNTTAPTPLAVAGARVAAYDLLSRPSPGADVATHQMRRQEAAAEFARLARLHQPRPGRLIHFEAPF